MNAAFLRAILANSRVLRSGHLSSRLSQPSQSNDAVDRTLIQLANSSLPVRGLSRMGDYVRAVWRDSICAARVNQWLALPAAERLRLAAIAGMVAFLTHIGLTGFDAPEPILTARVCWVVVLLLLWLTATRSHAIVAAWTEWKARGSAQTHEVR